MGQQQTPHPIFQYACVTLAVLLTVNLTLCIPGKNVEEPSDMEILQAVIHSMADYNERQATRSLRSIRQYLEPNAAHHIQKRDEEVVCYGDLGCFRDEGPFDYLDTLPVAPEHIRTRFLLYTNKNPSTSQLLDYANSTSLRTLYFNKCNPVKVMIHGFGSSCQKQWATDMRKALLSADDVNVICVDWENGAALPNYVQAAANARLVGKQVAHLIRSMNTLLGTTNSQFHLLGFSLGAHVAGFAGDELQNISRITGLDPAAPLFEGYATKARLDPSDADFVDVIHSNGDSLLYGGLGAFDAMGHVDYYPNGGKVQAGCSNIFVGAISDLIWYQPRTSDGYSLCNHRRAYKFFTDSVRPKCAFPAFACTDYESFLRGECFPCDPNKPNCGNMGYFADKSPARGKLYLQTRNTEPFCANQFKVIIESSSDLAPTYGALELTLVNWDHTNETFQVTSEWDELVPGRPLTRVIVAHPSMNKLVSAHMKYKPYKGWLTSGLQQWAVDRLIVIDSYGRRYSFCRRGLPLSGNQPTTVYLNKDDCNEGSTTSKAISIVPNLMQRPSNAATSVQPYLLDYFPKNTEASTLFKKHNRTIRKQLQPDMKDQIVYFQFFPMPIGLGNYSEGTRHEQSRNGVFHHMNNMKMTQLTLSNKGRKQKWQSHHLLASPSVPNFGIQKTRTIGSKRFMYRHLGSNRFGKHLPVDDAIRGRGPDIGAQIVFVPNGFHHHKTYIPLRLKSEPKRNNLSTPLSGASKASAIRPT